MGFFDGLGEYGRKRRRGLHLGGDGLGMERLEAQADATRLRLSDYVHEGVSRVPPPDDSDGADDEADDEGFGSGPDIHAMPTEKPHPAAQWDDVRGVWIRWDPDVNQWVDVS